MLMEEEFSHGLTSGIKPESGIASFMRASLSECGFVRA